MSTSTANITTGARRKTRPLSGFFLARQESKDAKKREAYDASMERIKAVVAARTGASVTQ